MDFLLEILRCPRTGQKLRETGGHLITADGKFSYRIDNGVPVLFSEEAVESRP